MARRHRQGSPFHIDTKFIVLKGVQAKESKNKDEHYKQDETTKSEKLNIPHHGTCVISLASPVGVGDMVHLSEESLRFGRLAGWCDLGLATSRSGGWVGGWHS